MGVIKALLGDDEDRTGVGGMTSGVRGGLGDRELFALLLLLLPLLLVVDFDAMGAGQVLLFTFLLKGTG